MVLWALLLAELLMAPSVALPEYPEAPLGCADRLLAVLVALLVHWECPADDSTEEPIGTEAEMYVEDPAVTVVVDDLTREPGDEPLEALEEAAEDRIGELTA